MIRDLFVVAVYSETERQQQEPSWVRQRAAGGQYHAGWFSRVSCILVTIKPLTIRTRIGLDIRRWEVQQSDGNLVHTREHVRV